MHSARTENILVAEEPQPFNPMGLNFLSDGRFFRVSGILPTPTDPQSGWRIVEAVRSTTNGLIFTAAPNGTGVK